MSSRDRNRAYQGALEAALAVAVSLGLGAWADDYFDTSPWFLLAGLGIGFAAFTVRLVRLADERNGAPRASGDDQKKGRD